MLRRLFRHERRQEEDEPHNRADQRRRRPFFGRFRSSSTSSSLVRAVTVGGRDFAGSDVSIDDLIEPLRRWRGRRRGVWRHINLVRRTCRESNLTYGGEWQLRVNFRQLVELLMQAPQVADLLLDFFFGPPLHHCHVVWLSDSHFLLCGDCEPVGGSLLDAFWWFPDLTLEDSRGLSVALYSLLDAELDQEGAEILRALHMVVASGTRISKVMANLGIITPQVIEAMVAQAQSPRMVHIYVFHHDERGPAAVPDEVGRIVAFSCRAGVELVAFLSEWEDRGAALAAAMRANRCPTRLALYGLDKVDVSSIIAPALECTVRIETLTIGIDGGDVADSVLSAIGRNRGIRTLVLESFSSSPIFLRSVKSVWTAIMASPSIRCVEFTGALHVDYVDWDRKACAEAVAELVQSTRVITSILYDARIVDEEIMELRVMPVVRANRLRADLEDVWASTGGRGELVASLLLGAPFVRHHPELLYVVLKSCREHLCLPGSNWQDGDDVPH